MHRRCTDGPCPCEDVLGKDEGTDIAAQSPPEGKDLNMPEHYFEDVLEGARLIESQCSKNIMFE